LSNRTRQFVFICAYGLSGFAGLIYQSSWTRMLTLWMGHTTAASSTVVAAFMGGLGIGALVGGRAATRLTPRQAIQTYAILEAAVVLMALGMPLAQDAMVPLLAWAYADGASRVAFPLVRLGSSLALLSIPALALGATFPMALRWFCARHVVSGFRRTQPSSTGRCGGALYASNTVGAAVGVVAAGFFTIPALGVSGTTELGIAASVLAIAGAIVVARGEPFDSRSPLAQSKHAAAQPAVSPAEASPPKRTRKRRPIGRNVPLISAPPPQLWLGVFLLAISGCLGMLYEIAWIRVLALVAGPTTYAFAATVAAVIAGLACGSAVGAWLAGRTRQPRLWLASVLAITALVTAGTAWFVGTEVPRMIAEATADAAGASTARIAAALVAALVLPTAAGLGVAFPLTLEVAVGGAENAVRSVGIVYCANTLAAAGGALAAGFVTIPAWGLQRTLQLVSVLLVIAAATALGRLASRAHVRAAALAPAAVAVALLIGSPPWSRDLLASGVYKYAAAVQGDVPREPALQAGTLLYYREGASGTVSVRELAGARSLAIDGKVDASTAADMLTQKALAHVPLLLHGSPRDVLVIGLGSGVTLASALTHPIRRADVVEISPEVVDASKYFEAVNRNSLQDPRTRLIVGDGRSHLHLSPRQYDVIVSEPSNPWMAGVAALFTREFFTAARDRLAPGGIICQWAHTYNITDADLRSIVATFRAVFPDGTMWLIGTSDLLLVASNGPLQERFANLPTRWEQADVRSDLRAVSAVEPFALLSLFAGGPREMERYAAGAPPQTDDRMALEFSGPLSVNLDAGDENARNILELGGREHAPPEVREAFSRAGAEQWRNRGTMMLGAEDYISAFDDYSRALALNPADEQTLRGLTRAAGVLRREEEVLTALRAAIRTDSPQPNVAAATARLLAATGMFAEAVSLVEQTLAVQPGNIVLLEQLASIFADTQEAPRLARVVATMEQLHAGAPRTAYYAAVLRFLNGDADGALAYAREAVRRDPAHGAAQNLVGVLYATLQQQQSAHEAFQAAIRLDPRDSVAYQNLGLLELNLGNDPAAAKYFVEALLLDPRSSVAREGLARAGRANMQ
jgi:spermidine synthase